MKKSTKLVRIILLTFCLILVFGITASAIIPYATYTHRLDGEMQLSPHAYVPNAVITSQTIKYSYNNGASDLTRQKYELTDVLDLKSPKDIFVDNLNHIYIADAGNNQIVGLDENYNIRLIISDFTNNQGVPDVLSNPNGVFVTDKEIYVADTDKSRVVVFDKTGKFVDIIAEPSSDVLPENSVYKPIALAVDDAGRIYVVSATTNYGVVSLNRDGSFNEFLGPQKVTYNAFEYFIRYFQTAEQKKQSVQNVATEFNNITIDKDGFIYVTTSSIDPEKVKSNISARSKSGDYAPVKKLNPNGSDVMNRNGLWPPSGEVDFRSDVFFAGGTEIKESSVVKDVALGPNGTWSIIDNLRSKVYTYDSEGNELYAFGDKGDQIGNIQDLIGIAYQGTNILLLDGTSGSITIYKRTDYGDLIDSAIKNTEDKNYNEAVQYYISILQHNNNYDNAYIGIGESFYRSGDYESAMRFFMDAHDTTFFSKAYQLYRKDWVEKNVWVIPVLIIVICVLISQFFKFANKYNKKGQKLLAKRTFLSEIMYGFHIIFHPFDGFWDLKHEKRGSVRGATFWLGITAAVFIYKALGQGYLFDQSTGGISFFKEIISVVLPLFLWVTANWCLTTLFEGEGSFKDVYIASCYSLIPLSLLIFPSVIASNFVTSEEIMIITFMSSLAFTWVGLLMFFAMMVVHDYTLGKNILTTIGTIIGVVFIMFVAVLFSTLLIKVFTFGYNIFTELKYRYWS